MPSIIDSIVQSSNTGLLETKLTRESGYALSSVSQTDSQHAWGFLSAKKIKSFSGSQRNKRLSKDILCTRGLKLAALVQEQLRTLGTCTHGSFAILP